MPFQNINNVNLYYEIAGSGESLVMVHGSWGDHHNWAPVVPLLSQVFRVVTFDRRGHSQSETAPGQGSFAEDADDLGALIEQLDLGPAHVVGNSGGAAIALRLAAKRPDLLRCLVVHEPPLLDLLKGRSEFESTLLGFDARVAAVVELLKTGEMQAAAERFVETVAFGPGAWAMLPDLVRETFIRNAPTFLDECNDPAGLTIDLNSLRAFDKPVLVTRGTESPPFFKPITEVVAQALPVSSFHIFEGGGHVPHLSQPETYVETVSQFCRQPSSRVTAARTVTPPQPGYSR
jgi:pimeloyl-ACP methyl ester carboxylesterase